jgi:murein DD-endopeptidase MepM/ murein hydrolase activator NlpD
VVFAAGLVACGSSGVTVPAGHPCPEIALAPLESRLWDELLDPPTPAPLTLLVPLEGVTSAVVSQANAQSPTHLGTVAYAWDLVVPEGTPVLAAAPGVVVWVRDDSSAHDATSDALDDANWIVVDHGGGLYSSYVHLALGSAEVAPGDLVDAGRRLATTGLSGQLTGAHLHFHVENAWSETLPAAFVSLDTTPRCDWVPATGETVARPADVAETLTWTGQVSEVPADAFALFGVPELRGAPARLFSRQTPYGLSGRVDPGMDEAWALVFPEAGGDAVAWVGMAVTDGHFAGTLDLSSLSPGRYGWAVVAVANGDQPFASRTLRLTLTP